MEVFAIPYTVKQYKIYVISLYSTPFRQRSRPFRLKPAPP